MCSLVNTQKITGICFISFKMSRKQLYLTNIMVHNLCEKSHVFYHLQEILDKIKSLMKPNDIISLFEVTPTSNSYHRIRLYKREIKQSTLVECWHSLQSARNIKRYSIWLLCCVTVLIFCYCCCFVF